MMATKFIKTDFFYRFWGTLIILLVLSSCSTTSRILKYNIPSIDDHKIFDNRTIHRNGEVTPLYVQSPETIPDVALWGLGKLYEEGMTNEEFYKKTGTVCLLVMRNDTILYEWYAPERSDTTIFTSFSLAKVYVSTLIGIAIKEGKIKSVEEPIGNYLDYCTDSAFCHLKIRHLLQMTSGLITHEARLNPFGTTPRLYYTPNLREYTSGLKMGKDPGTSFAYQSLNTQLLAEILLKATGKTVGQYLEEKIWGPLGMESDASWSLDREGGDEKAFCCLNARARDYARFGLLMLNHGIWNGDTIISDRWFQRITAADTLEGSRQTYQYHWYTTAEEEDFYGEGLLGQFTYICPSKNIVIVRLGKTVHFKQGWYDMLKILAGLEEKPVEITVHPGTLEKFDGTYTFGKSTTGDTSMVGKQVHLSPKGNHLKVKSDFYDSFLIAPQSETAFFHIPSGRKMRFELDESGKVKKMLWERRGNFWWVTKDAE